MTNSPQRTVTTIILPTLMALVLALILLSCGDNGTDPSNPPDITLFTTSPVDIMPGDSSLVTFKALRADSLVLTPPRQRLAENDSGQIWVKPAVPTLYTLTAYNGDGTDTDTLSVTMSGASANITQFAVSPSAVLGGDSSQLTWRAELADSIVVDHGIGKLADPDSGAIWVKPAATTQYRAVAYNIANDTAIATLTVEVPASVEARDGLYYKGEIGSSDLIPELQVYVADAQNARLTLPWIHFSLIEGDGALSPDSAQPGSARYVYPTYQFSGSLGHAVVRSRVPGVDSADVYLRANTLIPGDGGQGQYILFTDTFATVSAFNGTPESIDEDPRDWFNYVVYESSSGLVVMVWDNNTNRTADPGEAVKGIIVNTIYAGTTADGIGVGSHYNDIEAVYGAADTTYLDTEEPPADVYIYEDPPMTFFANPADSVVFEIHMLDPSPPPLSPAGSSLKPDRAEVSTSVQNGPRPYRRAVR